MRISQLPTEASKTDASGLSPGMDESDVGSRSFLAVCQSSKSPSANECSKSGQQRACYGPPIICYEAPSIAIPPCWISLDERREALLPTSDGKNR